MVAFLSLSAVALAYSPDRHPVFEPPVQQKQKDDGNLFLKAQVTASGAFEKDKPELAVDGEIAPDKYWGCENLPVWLQIDMGKEQSLSSIHLWTYWQDGRIYKYKIEGSQDGEKWSTLVDQSANSISGTQDGSVFNFDPVKIRYVRTTILDNSRGKANGGHIVEIKGFAQPEHVSLNASAFSTNARIEGTGEPAEAGRLTGIKQKAWRGERVNGQIALWSQLGVQDIFLRPAVLKGPNGSTIPVNVSFVRFTNAKGIPHADIIDPVKRLDLPGGTTRTVWVSADIPAKTAPGTYTGEIVAKGKGVDEVKVPVSIEVLPNILPAPSQWKCHVDLWQHPEAVARWHGVESWSDEHFALMKPVMKRLADAGQKTITCSLIHEAWNEQTYDWWPSMIEWIKKPDGTMTYDYTKFDKWVTFMLKDVGLDGTITCYTMIPWSLKLRYYDQARECYDSAVLKPGDPSYEALWGPFLKDLRNHAKAKGWLNKMCIGIDERPDHMVRAAKGIIDKYAPEFEIVSAVNAPSKITEDIYDFSVVFGHADTVTPELMDQRRKEGRKTTVYVCVQPKKPNTFTISPLAEAEWLGYFAAANHFDGFLRWAYNSWGRNPFETSDFGNWHSGDCYLVYPGNRSSLRFEKLRDGFEEFEKITILREKASKPGASTQLKEAVKTMDQTLSELFTIKKGFGDDHASDVEKAREAVIQAASQAK